MSQEPYTLFINPNPGFIIQVSTHGHLKNTNWLIICCNTIYSYEQTIKGYIWGCKRPFLNQHTPNKLRWTCVQISSYAINVCICTRLFRDPRNLILWPFAMFYYKWYLLTKWWERGGKGLNYGMSERGVEREDSEKG